MSMEKSVDRGGQRKCKIEQSETTSMKLTLNDGDAFADKLKAETFTLQSDYGDSTLSNVSGKTFTVQSECGDVKQSSRKQRRWN